MAAGKSDHRLGGLKQHKFILTVLEAGSPKSVLQGYGWWGWFPLEAPGENYFLVFFRFWRCLHPLACDPFLYLQSIFICLSDSDPLLPLSHLLLLLTFPPPSFKDLCGFIGLIWKIQDPLLSSRSLAQSYQQSAFCHVQSHSQVPGIRTWTYSGGVSLFSLARGHRNICTNKVHNVRGAGARAKNGRSPQCFQLSPEGEGCRSLPHSALFRTSSELNPKRLCEKSSLWVFPVLLCQDSQEMLTLPCCIRRCRFKAVRVVK